MLVFPAVTDCGICTHVCVCVCVCMCVWSCVCVSQYSFRHETISEENNRTQVVTQVILSLSDPLTARPSGNSPAFLLRSHPSGCCTLVVVEERPPHGFKALWVYNNTQ